MNGHFEDDDDEDSARHSGERRAWRADERPGPGNGGSGRDEASRGQRPGYRGAAAVDEDRGFHYDDDEGSDSEDHDGEDGARRQTYRAERPAPRGRAEVEKKSGWHDAEVAQWRALESRLPYVTLDVGGTTMRTRLATLRPATALYAHVARKVAAHHRDALAAVDAGSKIVSDMVAWLPASSDVVRKARDLMPLARDKACAQAADTHIFVDESPDSFAVLLRLLRGELRFGAGASPPPAGVLAATGGLAGLVHLLRRAGMRDAAALLFPPLTAAARGRARRVVRNFCDTALAALAPASARTREQLASVAAAVSATTTPSPSATFSFSSATALLTAAWTAATNGTAPPLGASAHPAAATQPAPSAPGRERAGSAAVRPLGLQLSPENTGSAPRSAAYAATARASSSRLGPARTFAPPATDDSRYSSATVAPAGEGAPHWTQMHVDRALDGAGRAELLRWCEESAPALLRAADDAALSAMADPARVVGPSVPRGDSAGLAKLAVVLVVHISTALRAQALATAAAAAASAAAATAGPLADAPTAAAAAALEASPSTSAEACWYANATIASANVPS